MYEARSRVKARIRERLAEDVELFEEEAPELLEEIRDVVCEVTYYCPRCGEGFDRPSDAHQHALHQEYQDDVHDGYDENDIPPWWPSFGREGDGNE